MGLAIFRHRLFGMEHLLARDWHLRHWPFLGGILFLHLVVLVAGLPLLVFVCAAWVELA